MKNFIHELVIVIQNPLGKIARSHRTPDPIRDAATVTFTKLNKLRFYVETLNGTKLRKRNP